MPATRTILQIPSATGGAQRRSSVFDADLDDHQNAIFAVGTDKTATHLLFGGGALVRLPAPLYGCRVRLLERDAALVWGSVQPPGGEPNAWIVNADGSARRTFASVHYAADVLCTDNFIVATFYDEMIDSGGPIPAEGVAVFDREGTFLWGWNGTIREAASIGDCDAAVRLGGDLVGVFASYEFPLVVLDLISRRPVTVHQPTPDVLHGAHAISMRDGLWYFVTPYQAKEAILSWRPQRGRPEIQGDMSTRYRCRGLPGGRFINVNEQGAEIMTLDYAAGPRPPKPPRGPSSQYVAARR
jgi:hypothetical protein